MSLVSREYTVPDAYFAPGESQGPVQAWEALNPCPACGASPHDSPHGVMSSGDPHWQFEHCWKCGYRPGVNNVVSQSELTRQFQAFQAYVAQQSAADANHPSLNAPAPDQVAELKAQMAAMQADLARYRDVAASGGPTSSAPVTEG